MKVYSNQALIKNHAADYIECLSNDPLASLPEGPVDLKSSCISTGLTKTFSRTQQKPEHLTGEHYVISNSLRKTFSKIQQKPGCPYPSPEDLAKMIEEKTGIKVVLGTHDYH